MRISKNLYLVGSGISGTFVSDELDCNCYAVDCGSELVLVDSGLGSHPEMIESNITNEGLDIKKLKKLLLTHGHADHMGGASYFAEKYGLEVFAPEREAGYIRTADEKMLGLDVARNAGYYPADYKLKGCRVDRGLGHGERFPAGGALWDTVGVAGHSIGGICYRCSLEDGVLLFTGDHLLFGGRISLQNIPGADVHEYARTTKLLAGLGADMLLPGHGLFCVKGGQSHADQCIKSFEGLFVPG